MKKIIVLAGLLITFSPELVSAQILARTDVEARMPQLTSLVSSLNATGNYIRTRIATENVLFRQYLTALISLSQRLNSNPPPTNSELESTQQKLTEIQAQISLASNWRARVNTATSNIRQILGNISVIISSAV